MSVKSKTSVVLGGMLTGIVAAFVVTTAASTAATTVFVPGTKAVLGSPSTTNDPTQALNGKWSNDPYKVLDYPASFGPLTGLGDPTFGMSIYEGQRNLQKVYKPIASPTTLVGFSQGSLVIREELRRMDQTYTGTDGKVDPSVNVPKQYVDVYLLGDPMNEKNGLLNSLKWFPLNTGVLFGTGYNPQPLETRYDIKEVTREYDGWADFPDRPLNLISVANAVAGIVYIHPDYSKVDLNQIPPENISTTVNSKGGKTTYYLDPTVHLPLVQPLRDIGIPEPIVQAIERPLKVIVDTGYARNDGKLQDNIKGLFGQTTSPVQNKVTEKVAEPTVATPHQVDTSSSHTQSGTSEKVTSESKSQVPESVKETETKVSEEKTEVKTENKVQKPQVKKNPLSSLFSPKKPEKVTTEKKDDSVASSTKVEKQNPLKKILDRGSGWSNPNKSVPKTKVGAPTSSGDHTSSGDSSPSNNNDHQTQSHSEGHSKTSE